RTAGGRPTPGGREAAEESRAPGGGGLARARGGAAEAPPQVPKVGSGGAGLWQVLYEAGEHVSQPADLYMLPVHRGDGVGAADDLRHQWIEGGVIGSLVG